MLEYLLNRYWPIVSFDAVALRLLGYLFVAIAVVLNIAAIRLFMKQKTTIVPHGKPSKLVVDGPYRLTRNPMYLALLCVLIGVATLFGSLSLYLIPIAFVFIINTVFIRMEEANMSTKFGDQYALYSAKVRRWL